jgi:hypothetical protein
VKKEKEAAVEVVPDLDIKRVLAAQSEIDRRKRKQECEKRGYLTAPRRYRVNSRSPIPRRVRCSEFCDHPPRRNPHDFAMANGAIFDQFAGEPPLAEGSAFIASENCESLLSVEQIFALRADHGAPLEQHAASVARLEKACQNKAEILKIAEQDLRESNEALAQERERLEQRKARIQAALGDNWENLLERASAAASNGGVDPDAERPAMPPRTELDHLELLGAAQAETAAAASLLRTEPGLTAEAALERVRKAQGQRLRWDVAQGRMVTQR